MSDFLQQVRKLWMNAAVLFRSRTDIDGVNSGLMIKSSQSYSEGAATFLKYGVKSDPYMVNVLSKSSGELYGKALSLKKTDIKTVDNIVTINRKRLPSKSIAFMWTTDIPFINLLECAQRALQR